MKFKYRRIAESVKIKGPEKMNLNVPQTCEGEWECPYELTHIELRGELVELAKPVPFTLWTKQYIGLQSFRETRFNHDARADTVIDGEKFSFGAHETAYRSYEHEAIKRMVAQITRGLANAQRYNKPHRMRQFLGEDAAAITTERSNR